VTAQSWEAIQQVPLDPLVVTRIPVSMNGPTTVRFPSPVSDLEGAFISTDPSSSAPFLLSFRPGSSFFSVRALAPGTNTSLNIVWKNQTYVLELDESKTPWLSVIFTESPVAPASDRHQPVTPSRLLGLLDTAKAYPLLRTQHPEAVVGVEFVRPGTLNDYGSYSIKTEEVFRFDGADTLVFRIGVSNKTAQTMRYLPQSLMVQAGSRVFYQSITDGSGEIPPQSTVPIYFAITGTADGKRNDISPRNDFLVLLQRVDSPPEASRPAAAVPNGGNLGLQATRPATDLEQPTVSAVAPSPVPSSVIAPGARSYQPPPTIPAWSTPQPVSTAVQSRTVGYPTTPVYYNAPVTVYYYASRPQTYYYPVVQYYSPPTPVYYVPPVYHTGFFPFGFGYGR
jgi:hypothetical protein